MELDFGPLARRLEDRAKRGLRLAAAHLEGAMKDSVSRQGVVTAKTKAGRAKARAQLAERGLTEIVSKPGEPPARRTGTLRASIRTEVLDDGLRVRVGTSLNYGIWLEFGTEKMAPRPFLRRAFEEEKDVVRQIIDTELRSGGNGGAG